MLVWVALVWVAPRIQVGPTLHQAVLFAHLAALVLGLGAVLTVDWFGLLYLLRRTTLATVVQVTGATHLPIWLGLAGLVLTGAILAPPAWPPLTLIKVAAVLVVALNGLYARRLQQRLAAYQGGTPPRAVLLRGAGAVAISQLGWWLAAGVGFLSAHS